MKLRRLIKPEMAAIIPILVVSFLNIIPLRKDLISSRRGIGNDEISYHDERFKKLKGMLPNRVIIGYISDKTPDNFLLDGEAVKSYYLAQYALSPILVSPYPDHELVVGNFQRLTTNRVPPESMTLVADFGNGVMLLKMKDK